MFAELTCPASTAFFSASPKYLLSGISWSSPFSAESTVEWVAPQSLITQPSNFNCFLKMSCSRCAFSHE